MTSHDPELARRVARADFFGRLTRIVALGLLIGILGLLVWLAISIRDTQLEGTPTGKAILESSNRIKSCTTPGADCYERGVRAQAGAISSINEITIYAVTCGQQNPDASVTVVQDCVQSLYDEQHPRK